MSPKVIPTQACPQCGYVVELASGLRTPAVPSAGDLCVCLKCGVVQIFDPMLRLCIASAADLAALEPADRAIVRRACELIRSKKHLPS